LCLFVHSSSCCSRMYVLLLTLHAYRSLLPPRARTTNAGVPFSPLSPEPFFKVVTMRPRVCPGLFVGEPESLLASRCLVSSYRPDSPSYVPTFHHSSLLMVSYGSRSPAPGTVVEFFRRVTSDPPGVLSHTGREVGVIFHW